MAATTASVGGCDKASMGTVVRQQVARFKPCYEKVLAHDQALKGKLTVQWTITGMGTVNDLKLTSDIPDGPQVDDCVVGALSPLKFGPPESGVCVVQWPLEFEPQ